MRECEERKGRQGDGNTGPGRRREERRTGDVPCTEGLEIPIQVLNLIMSGETDESLSISLC